MPNIAHSITAYQRDVRRANRSVSLEMASVLSFLAGLVLAAIVVWLLAMSFVSTALPEDKDFFVGDYLFPQLDENPWFMVVGVSSLLVPAAMLMLAGVVAHYFFERDEK